jgi:hypothetical protein
MPVEKRSRRYSIAAAKQYFPTWVPDRERKLARKTIGAFLAPLLIGSKNEFLVSGKNRHPRLTTQSANENGFIEKETIGNNHCPIEDLSRAPLIAGTKT